MTNNIRFQLRKPCVRCGKLFFRSGKYERICNKCHKPNAKKIKKK